ncbi:MAG: GTPase Era [Alphaproteobacteria bacterium]|nr:GTPase Era [Alphaproteobacteria bacterium]
MENKTRCGFVALIGAPNAGKSTITNNFVGSKVSIVSPKVQTTRTLVRGINIFENSQIIFIDTPGIFKPKRRLDRAMVSSAWNGANDADIIVLVIDAKRGFDAESKEIVKKLNENKLSAILMLNKIDLVKKEKLLALITEINTAGNFKEIFMASALTGKHIEDFYKYLADNLPESPWFYPEDQISDMPLKLLAAEITREKLFTYLHQEIPYSLTVETDVWERKEDGSVKAQQTIYVERDNQKSIILGKGGSMIKRIGQSARIELEDLIDSKVHLFLFVKVRENWMNDSSRYEDWNLDFNA